jgi:hypothetical protein
MFATQSWKKGLSGFGEEESGGLKGCSRATAVQLDGIAGAGVVTG